MHHVGVSEDSAILVFGELVSDLHYNNLSVLTSRREVGQIIETVQLVDRRVPRPEFFDIVFVGYVVGDYGSVLGR
jgi:hypothetical protein